MKHKYQQSRLKGGFALPTVLIASVIMLSILVTAVSSIGSASAAIDSQYYNQLAREAAESGMARASDCLKQTPNYTAQWSDASPLMPNTNCDGSIIPGASQWLVNNGNTRTTFRIGTPTTGSANTMRIAAGGVVDLVRASNQNTAWRTYSQSLTQDNRYRGQPKIAGGAGWQSNGHIAVITSVDNQLYGFGSNYAGQVTTENSPTNVLYPEQYPLPTGVTSATKVRTSGQGASWLCFLGNNNQVYCRGEGLGNTNPSDPNGYWSTWTQFALPSGVTASDFTTDGYGKDAVCVLGSDGQVYCAGENQNGSLGNGSATYGIVQLTAPTKFILPAGVKASKVIVGTHIVCAITTETPYNRLFCAGSINYGQIGQSTTGAYATPVQWPVPGYRNVKSAIVSYHTMNDDPVLHVLMTDGTIWSTGIYNYGDLGNGQNTGSTGTSRTPSMFDPTGNGGAWQTGISFTNPQAGRCIDNTGGANYMNNGNVIEIYDCNGTGNQRLVMQSNGSLVFTATGKCLDDPSNSTSPGIGLQLYDCNGSAAQQFTFSTDSNGKNIIKHVSSGMCVDVKSGGTTNGTVVDLYTCNNTGSQIFNRTGVQNGWTDMLVGADTFCAFRSDSWSGMWCAGQNNWGQLMNYSQPGSFYNSCQGTNSTYSVMNVNLPNGVKPDPSKLSDEWRQQFQSLQVIATDGNVYSTGRDQYGKFGTGVIGDTNNDYEVCQTYSSLANMQANQPGGGSAVSISFALPSGVTALDMSTRDQFTTYVLGSDLRVYAAGLNSNGQIGDGTTTNRLTPVMVKLPRVGTNY